MPEHGNAYLNVLTVVLLMARRNYTYDFSIPNVLCIFAHVPL